MGYKWKPSKAAKREFAQRMQDPQERAAYEARKQERAAKRRAGSKYDYASAGGAYVPTKSQFEFACKVVGRDSTFETEQACQAVIYGYGNNEKVHHDFIHVVNELIRSEMSINNQ